MLLLLLLLRRGPRTQRQLSTTLAATQSPDSDWIAFHPSRLGPRAKWQRARRLRHPRRRRLVLNSNSMPPSRMVQLLLPPSYDDGQLKAISRSSRHQVLDVRAQVSVCWQAATACLLPRFLSRPLRRRLLLRLLPLSHFRPRMQCGRQQQQQQQPRLHRRKHHRWQHPRF